MLNFNAQRTSQVHPGTFEDGTTAWPIGIFVSFDRTESLLVGRLHDHFSCFVRGRAQQVGLIGCRTHTLLQAHTWISRDSETHFDFTHIVVSRQRGTQNPLGKKSGT